MSVAKPATPYIILESISREKNVSKGLYVINSVGDESSKMVN